MTFKKGMVVSDETRKKLSDSHKGKPTRNKGLPKELQPMFGKKISKEILEKISLSKKGKTAWNKGTKGLMGKGRTGSYPTEETRKKLSESHIGLQVGEKSGQWKGGITPENIKIRNSLEYSLWRDSCFKRDNYTCSKCGNNGGKLNVHHINNFSSHKDLRLAIDNGITLCKLCHNMFHRIYGVKNNTKEQLHNFLSVDI